MVDGIRRRGRAPGGEVLGRGRSHDFVAEEEVERFRELVTRFLIVLHVDLVEDALVHLSPLDGGSAQVRGMPVRGKGQSLFEIHLHPLRVHVECECLAFDGIKRCFDPVLLGSKEINRDRSRVVAIEKLRSLAVETASTALHGGSEMVAVSLLELDLLGQVRPDGVDQRVERLDGQVVILDERLDLFDQHGSLLAVVSLLMPTGTHEVRVDASASTLGVGDDQPGAALAAVHGPLQVVRVLPNPLARVGLGREDMLDAIPDLRGDEWLVTSLVLDTAIDDGAFVIGVAEQSMKVRLHERLRRVVRRRCGVEALLGYLVEQLPDRPLAGRVLVERPRHERSSHRVDHDGSDLLARAEVPDVQVAGGCFADGSAGLGLLGAAFDHLVCKVPAVELGDRTHDAVHESATGRLVDVLGAADQGCARCSECDVDLNVVDSVASEAVDLVHDHVLDGVGGDVGEHALQFWPVSGLRAFTTIDELLDDHRTERRRLPLTHVSLRWDREALCVETSLGLVLRGYADVRNGPREAGRCVVFVLRTSRLGAHRDAPFETG